jgi:hypothetical protein
MSQEFGLIHCGVTLSICIQPQPAGLFPITPCPLPNHLMQFLSFTALTSIFGWYFVMSDHNYFGVLVINMNSASPDVLRIKRGAGLSIIIVMKFTFQNVKPGSSHWILD